jgi:hypothetical protein
MTEKQKLNEEQKLATLAPLCQECDHRRLNWRALTCELGWLQGIERISCTGFFKLIDSESKGGKK